MKEYLKTFNEILSLILENCMAVFLQGNLAIFLLDYNRFQIYNPFVLMI